MRDAYFPATSIVSINYLMESGSAAEIALIGREAMVGVPLLFGGAISTDQASVQSSGFGFKLPGRCLINKFERGGNCARAAQLCRFPHRADGTNGCNRHGTLEQRLCRWLLMTLDRLPGNELAMTHEFIANTLGVKHEGVTKAASSLRRMDRFEPIAELRRSL